VLIPAANECNVCTYTILLGHAADEVFPVEKKIVTFRQLEIEIKQAGFQID
jgi:hypothetical protein